MSDSWDKYGFQILKSPTLPSESRTNAINCENETVVIQDCFSNDFDDRCHLYSSDENRPENDHQWQRVFSKWDSYRQCVKREKLKELIRHGVPLKTRPELWKKLLDLDTVLTYTDFSYEEQVSLLREELVSLGVSEFNTSRSERVLSETEEDQENMRHFNLQSLRQILLDVGRTYPTHCMFSVESDKGIEGRAALFRLLAVYTVYNPENNYCQGMSYLAAMFLMQLEEKEAFWALVSLLERRKYLFGYFDKMLEKVQSHAKVFDKILDRHLPNLHHHLNKLGIDPLMYTTPWVMCVFTSLPCWDTVLSIWDLLLLEGNVVIFQTSLAILKILGPTLLKINDTNRAIPVLQKVPHLFSRRETLMPAVFSTHFEIWEVYWIQAVVKEEGQKSQEISTPNSLLQKNRLGRVLREKKKGSQRQKMTVLEKIGSLLWGEKNKKPGTPRIENKHVSASNNVWGKRQGVAPRHIWNYAWSSDFTGACKPSPTKRLRLSATGPTTPESPMCGVLSPANFDNVFGSSANRKLAFREFQGPLPPHAGCTPKKKTLTPSAVKSPAELREFSLAAM